MDVSIGDRIRVLRNKNNLNLTQTEFGARIGLKQTAIGLYENGDRNVSDRSISDICREFNVNEEWLRTGGGEMFISVPTDALDALAERYGLSAMAKRFVKSFVELDGAEMDAVLGFMEKVVLEGSAEDTAPAFAVQHERLDTFKNEIDRARSILDAQAGDRQEIQHRRA